MRRGTKRSLGSAIMLIGTATTTMLEVTVKGQPHPETGYVIDLGELKRILHEAIVLTSAIIAI